MTRHQTAIDEASQLETLRKEVAANPSTSDAVTGLPNRLGLSRLGEHVISVCGQTDQQMSLLVFRLTNLADIDESLGYSEGDRVVVELMGLLQASFPDCQVIGRPTFDTFGILISGSGLEGVDSSHERLAALVSEFNDNRPAAHELELKTDAVLHQPDSHPGVEEMIREAEERMDNPQILGADESQLVVLSSAPC